jgi:hypothetical protein
MADMDHVEAMRLGAAEKYVLGELAGDVRDAYEEHYFECVECARDVKAAAMLLEGVRQVSRDQAQTAAERESVRLGWLDRAFVWMRPALAASAFAVLLAAVAYQNLFTIPALKSRSKTAAASIYGPSFSLIGANVRGGSAVEISVRPGEGYLLDFDFIPSSSAASYVVELQDSSGHVLLKSTIPESQANQTLHFAVPAGTTETSGPHALVFYRSPASGAPDVKGVEVQRLPFTVAFRN